MEGTVLHYSSEEGTGIIKDSEGKRYNFTKNDLKSPVSVKSGHKVDFEAENDIAHEIYSLNAPNVMDDALGKVSSATNSQVAQKIVNLLKNGFNNKFGTVMALATIVTLFLPVIEIPFMGKGALINDWFGKLLFLMLGVSAVLFYGGASKIYTKSLVSLTGVLIFFQLYDLYAGLSQGNDMLNAFSRRGNINFLELLQYGFFAVILFNSLFLFSAFKKSYKENENTI